MKHAVSLTISAALLGAVAFAMPALAMEQVHIPNTSAAQDSATPDGLFDKSIPDTWQKKSDGDSDQQSAPSGLQFTVRGGSNYANGTDSGFVTQQQQPTGGQYRENATTPGSEFYNNGATVQLQPFGQ